MSNAFLFSAILLASEITRRCSLIGQEIGTYARATSIPIGYQVQACAISLVENVTTFTL